MSFNLVDLIKDQVSGPALGQLGSLLGESSSVTQAGLNAAVPGLLNGLSESARGDGGASLFNTINNHDDSVLDNIGGMFSAEQSRDHINNGNGLLSGILGSGALGTLGNVVSKISGIGGRSSSSLLSLLAPIVLGVIKRKLFSGDGSFSQNAGGLIGLLNGQKDNIHAAMPNGFASELNSAGFSGNPTGTAGTTTASTVEHRGSTDGGWMRKLLPVAAALAIALIGWNFLKGNGKDVAERTSDAASTATTTVSDTATQTANIVTETATNAVGNATETAGNTVASAADGVKVAVPSVMVGDRDFGEELGGILSNATETVNAITDVDTAKSALPALSDIGSRVDGLSGLWDQLPDLGKGTISKMTSDGMGSLDGALQKVSALDGVGDIISPAVGPLMEKLKAFSGQ